MIEIRYTLLELFEMYKRCISAKMDCEYRREKGLDWELTLIRSEIEAIRRKMLK